MDICWKFLRNHLQNLSAVGVHYYASVNFIQYNLHFFQMASQDSLRFFARTISQQGKGGKRERERERKGGEKKIPYPPFPLVFFPLCFLNQKKKTTTTTTTTKKQNKTKHKNPGETEQMLKNRFLKITVNQS